MRGELVMHVPTGRKRMRKPRARWRADPARALAAPPWLHTGDIGHLDHKGPGSSSTDRKKT